MKSWRRRPGSARDRQLVQGVHVDSDAPLLRQDAGGRSGVEEEIVHEHRLAALRPRPRFRGGQREDVAQDPSQPLRLRADRLERLHVVGRLPVPAERHVGVALQHGDRRPELVGGVGGELAHAGERRVDRPNRAEREHPPPHARQEQGGGRRGREGQEQPGVLVVDLERFAPGHHHPSLAVGQHDGRGVGPLRPPARQVDLHDPRAGVRGDPGEPEHPRRGGVGVQQPAVDIEEVECAVGDMELVQRVHLARSRRPLPRPDLRRRHDRVTRLAERPVELRRRLLGDHPEQRGPERQEEHCEDSDVPRGEPDPEASQTLDHGPNR